jgi:hypothetical protein
VQFPSSATAFRSAPPDAASPATPLGAPATAPLATATPGPAPVDSSSPSSAPAAGTPPSAAPAGATPETAPGERAEPEGFERSIFSDSLFADHPRQEEPFFPAPTSDEEATPGVPDVEDDAARVAALSERPGLDRPEAANARPWRLRAFAAVLGVVAVGVAWKMVSDGTRERSLGTVFADASTQDRRAAPAHPATPTAPFAPATTRPEGTLVAAAPTVTAAPSQADARAPAVGPGTAVALGGPSANPTPVTPSPATTPAANIPQTVATATAPQPEQPRATLQGQRPAAAPTSGDRAERATPGAMPGQGAAPAAGDRLALAKSVPGATAAPGDRGAATRAAAATHPDAELAAKTAAPHPTSAANPDWTPEEVARAAARARMARRQMAEGTSTTSPAAPTESVSTTAAPAPAADVPPAPAANPRAAAPGQTLQQAADAGDVTSIHQLLATPGTTVDAPDSFGRTALMHAVLAQHPAAVRALLAAGADPNRADRAGFTPRAAAQTGGNDEIVQMIGPAR